MTPDFRRWLEKLERLERRAGTLRRHGYTTARSEEWAATTLSPETSAEVDALLTNLWRTG